MTKYTAGRKLDRLLAARVMGETVVETGECNGIDNYWLLRATPDVWEWPALPRYSSDIACAWEVVDVLRRGYHFALISRGRIDGQSEQPAAWQAECTPYGPDMRLFRAIADTPSLAICRVALQALDKP